MSLNAELQILYQLHTELLDKNEDDQATGVWKAIHRIKERQDNIINLPINHLIEKQGKSIGG